MKLTLNTEKILAEIDEGVGWITINNPERRNALSLEMWAGIEQAANAFAADPATRVVVIRGAGGKSFAAGADITEFEQQRANAEQKQRYGELASRGQSALAGLPMPLLALIQGFCVGGGLALALKADVRFATPASRFAIPAGRLGLGYEYPGLAALARVVGPSVAKDILFSARFLEADEALRVGLINTVVDDDGIEAHVRRYAASVAANAPLTLRAAKEAIRTFERMPVDASVELADELVNRCFDSEDYKEGRQAFLEKRKPVFLGR
jgi:enoyl-CoA hydratase